jgi:hypothetical protein
MKAWRAGKYELHAWVRSLPVRMDVNSLSIAKPRYCSGVDMVRQRQFRNDTFLVVERDNQQRDDAQVKLLYSVWRDPGRDSKAATCQVYPSGELRSS